MGGLFSGTTVPVTPCLVTSIMSSIQVRRLASQKNDPSWFVVFQDSVPQSDVRAAAKKLYNQGQILPWSNLDRAAYALTIGYYVEKEFVSLINVLTLY